MNPPVIVQKFIDRNFDKTRNGKTIKKIIIHTYGGGGKSLYNWFNRDIVYDPIKKKFFLNGTDQEATPASAHYSVFKDGGIEQYVRDEHRAYHASSANDEGIGIEHQDDKQPADSIRTPELYESSAKLVAFLCWKHKIPCNSDYIEPHRKYATDGRSCPGGLDINRIIRRANELLNGEEDMAKVQELETKLKEVESAAKWWMDSSNEQKSKREAAEALAQDNLSKFSALSGEFQAYKAQVEETSKNFMFSLEELKKEHAVELKVREDSYLAGMKEIKDKLENLDKEVQKYREENAALKLDNQKLTKQRDEIQISFNKLKSGISDNGGLSVKDLPSPVMHWWQKLEEKVGKKWTYLLTSLMAGFAAIDVPSVLNWVTTHFAGTGLVDIVNNVTSYIPLISGILAINRPDNFEDVVKVTMYIIAVVSFVVGWKKDRSTKNKNAIEAAKENDLNVKVE